MDMWMWVRHAQVAKPIKNMSKTAKSLQQYQIGTMLEVAQQCKDIVGNEQILARHTNQGVHKISGEKPSEK